MESERKFNRENSSVLMGATNPVLDDIFPYRDKRNHMHTLSHSHSKTFRQKDFLDIESIVKDSVERINDLFNSKEFIETQRNSSSSHKKTKHNFIKRAKKAEKSETLDNKPKENLNQTEINNKDNNIKATNKTNVTFNINNFINVPQEKGKNFTNTILYEIDEMQNNNNKLVKKLGKVYNNKIEINKNNNKTLTNDVKVSGLKVIKNKCKNKSINFRNNKFKLKSENNKFQSVLIEKANEKLEAKKKYKLKEKEKEKSNLNNTFSKTGDNFYKMQKEFTTNGNLTENTSKIVKKEKPLKTNNFFTNISKQKKSSEELVKIKKFQNNNNNVDNKNKNNNTNNKTIKVEKTDHNSDIIDSDEEIKQPAKRVGSITDIHRAKNSVNIGRNFGTEFKQSGSNAYFHKIVNSFYNKEFPSKISTNDILKLMLFLNEYLLNNNLLNDQYKKENAEVLENYSKFISSKIEIDHPEKKDSEENDNTLKNARIIQRKWRKKKINNYMEKNKKNEKEELKRMVVNNYIQKSGFKIKKILGMFNTIVENFDNVNKQNDINEMLYQVKKLSNGNLTNYEKNMLYKNFINSVIYLK